MFLDLKERVKLEMKKHVKEKPFYDLGKKPHLDSIKSVILLLDGYLAWFFDDPAPFSQAIRQGALGREFALEWRKIEKVLQKIAYSVRLIPDAKKHIFMQGVYRILSFLLITIAFGLAITGPYISGSLTAFMYINAATIILVNLGGLFLVLSWKEGKRFAEILDQYSRTHPEKFKLKRDYLRSVVQKLIYSLAYYAKKQGKDLDKVKFKLFNAFYRGIAIVKKPKWFRKRYIVKFNPSELPF